MDHTSLDVSIQRVEQTSRRLRVAAIVPLYNGEAFIREALESILSQTVPADDIVVVDDGSSDRGVAVVETLMRENAQAPIRLLRKSNGGQSSARNLGIASTGCELIALLDQDDVWYPKHIELLREPFDRDALGEIGLVYGNLDQIDLAGRIVQRDFLNACPSTHPKTSRMQCLSEDLYILPGASLLRKSAVEAAGRFDERLVGYEDDDLFLRMFSLGAKLVYINVAVYKWRIYSASTSYSPRMAQSRMVYFLKLTELYPDEPGVGWYWTTEIIAPRFFRQVVYTFLDGLRKKDRAQANHSLESARQIAPFLPPDYKRAFDTMLPVVQIMLRLSLDALVIRWVGSKLRS